MKYILPKNWRYILIAVLVAWSSLSFAERNLLIAKTAGFIITAEYHEECHEFSENGLSSNHASHCSSSVSAILSPHNLTYKQRAVSPNDDIADLYQFNLCLRKKKPPRYFFPPDQPINTA